MLCGVEHGELLLGLAWGELGRPKLQLTRGLALGTRGKPRIELGKLRSPSRALLLLKLRRNTKLRLLHRPAGLLGLLASKSCEHLWPLLELLRLANRRPDGLGLNWAGLRLAWLLDWAEAKLKLRSGWSDRLRLGWPGLNRLGLYWSWLSWPQLSWLNWPRLNWLGLNWPGLNRLGLNWPELSWLGWSWPELGWLGWSWPGLLNNWPWLLGSRPDLESIGVDWCRERSRGWLVLVEGLENKEGVGRC